MSLSPATKGGLVELKAAAWLLGQGYEVFRNVTADGPIDLVAIKGDERVLIDVKSANTYRGKSYTPTISEAQKELGVRILYPVGVGWSWVIPG